MVAPQRPLWGTLDADGRLVLSTDRAAIKELLGLEDNRYNGKRRNGRSVLTTTVDGSGGCKAGWKRTKKTPAGPGEVHSATKLTTRR